MRWLYDSFGSNPKRSDDDHELRKQAWTYCARQRFGGEVTLEWVIVHQVYEVEVHAAEGDQGVKFTTRNLGTRSFWKTIEHLLEVLKNG